MSLFGAPLACNLPKFHDTRLRVEREIGYVNVTRALVNSRRFPYNASVAVQNRLVHYRHNIVSVGVVIQNQIWSPNVIGGHVKLQVGCFRLVIIII